MSRQRVYFFNRFFWPDNSATAQILTDLCRGLDQSRFAITVVTSRLNYGDSGQSYPPHETLQGVEIRRLWSTRFGRANLFGRLADYLTIYLSFFIFIVSRLGPDDVAVFKTDPPLLSVPGAVGKTIKGFRMIAWCQDVFPEVATAELRFPKGASWLPNALAAVRDWSLVCSERVVVLGKDMRRFLMGRGISGKQLQEISNWSVQQDESTVTGATLREEWGIPADDFVVGYSGNLGRAHDWKTILQAAFMLKEERDLRFLCSGGGYGYERLREAVEESDVQSMFTFLPYQPLEKLGASLKVPDLHWLTLKDALTPFIFPSKFFGILQAGRPLVFIGSTDGEIADLAHSNRIGCAIREGEAHTLAGVIKSLKADRAGTTDSGKRARALWEERFQKSVEIAKWNALLDQFYAERWEAHNG